MLWNYTPDLDVDITGQINVVPKCLVNHTWRSFVCEVMFNLYLRPSVSLLEKYNSAGMRELWAASSFKGSTSVYTCVPSTLRHVDNHLQWLKVAASLSDGVTLQGIAITGWQR